MTTGSRPPNAGAYHLRGKLSRDDLNSIAREGIARRNNDHSSDESWHLLERDEDEYLCNDNNNETNCESNNDVTRSAVDDGFDCLQKKLHQRKKYVDIEQDFKGYSKRLIHVCTALYSLIPPSSILIFVTLFILLFTRYFYISLLYVAFMIYDKNTYNRGGRRIDFIYSNKFWSYLAAYFPIKLRHSTEFKLNPSRNYILGYHPHGISAFGAVTAFATNGLKFKELFPGITARFMVHETSFISPVLKETFSLRGDCSVNSRSIDYILQGRSKHKTGNLLTIVIGGLAEADQSELEILKVFVARRKGFVKKALIHGADLIPCLSFGENSVFTKVNFKPGSLLERMESGWYKLFKFKHPIYYGRSIVSSKLKGGMPYKRPITVVMGDPILVDRNERPSQEDIDKLHAHYLEQLKDLYAANKDLCKTYDRVLELI